MLFRIALLVSILVPVLRQQPSARRNAGLERALVGRAAMRLAHTRAPEVARWLQRQTGVASAVLGRDGRTIDIHFPDGTEAAVLPAIPRTTRVLTIPSTKMARTRLDETAGRALILEPFATELYLGPTAGDLEANALRSAGFSVTQAYDGSVTVATMESLPRYNVVYMLTHSGVNSQGEGVIATGQVADDDATVQSLLDDHTVIIVGVAGSSLKFYGVLSTYFSHHVAQFPPSSLLFVNGCSMLRGTLVWRALADRGVRTMVSWDGEAMSNDDVAAAQVFFDSLATGRSVAQSIADVGQSGHAVSVVGGTVARLGYLGDASLTLHDVLYPPAPTPAPTATMMPSATATATATVLPTRVPLSRRPWPRVVPMKTAIRMLAT